MNCKKSSLVFLWCITSGITAFSQVSISPTTTTPDPSAMLDIQSTDKGVLVPRLTTAQRESVAMPAMGLLVFDIIYRHF